MVLVSLIELYQKDHLNEPETIRTPETGKIVVDWQRINGAYCARIAADKPENPGNYLGGNFYGRMKLYFRNGYVWDTVLKAEDEWRKMIYDALKRYIDSGYKDLPGEYQSEMSRAARLLDDEMQYEI
jgi:hypothetical protein